MYEEIIKTDPESVIGITPHVDIDEVYTWVTGKLTQAVITGLGKTKTIIYGWTGDELTSVSVIITTP